MPAPPRTCCGPCSGRGFCAVEQRNCCLECHFSFEEEFALPYLPPDLAQLVRADHRVLIQQGFPADLVEAHARWEDQVFRQYVPTEIMQIIERDHRFYERGVLRSRASP